MPTQETTDVLITLYVNTVDIQQYINDPTNPGVLQNVFIASNWTDANSPTETLTGTDGKTTFITDVQGNSQISWVGAVEDIQNNQSHYVLITEVDVVTDNIGINIRNKESGSGDTHIDGLVNARPGVGSGATADYKISFSVGVGGNIVGNFSVDPQLRMK